MNPVQFHLALNHVPVIGAALMVLLLAWGMFRRSKEVVRAALWITVLLAISGYVAMATGERAEEYVEDAAWFDEGIAHDHEELGELSMKVMLATGALALIALWGLRGDRELGRLWPTVTLVALVASSGLVGWTAAKGGEIRHVEIRPGSARPLDQTAPRSDPDAARPGESESEDSD